MEISKDTLDYTESDKKGEIKTNSQVHNPKEINHFITNHYKLLYYFKYILFDYESWSRSFTSYTGNESYSNSNKIIEGFALVLFQLHLI